jgi:hypothetical protein
MNNSLGVLAVVGLGGGVVVTAGAMAPTAGVSVGAGEVEGKGVGEATRVMVAEGRGGGVVRIEGVRVGVCGAGVGALQAARPSASKAHACQYRDRVAALILICITSARYCGRECGQGEVTFEG